MAENKRKYWLHRITGGVNGRKFSIPLLDNYNILSIGWSFISTDYWLKEIKLHEIEAIDRAYEEEGADPQKNRFCLLNFVTKMQPGDIVVVPRNAYLGIYRIADDKILTNESLPNRYLEDNYIVRNKGSLATADGLPIDLGFYRKVIPVTQLVLRSQVDPQLYAKTRTWQTNIDISDISDTIERTISRYKISRSQKKTVKDAYVLSDIQIKNYKNLANLRIDGLKRINLIVGSNNAGKSNLLEALWLYSSYISHERMRDILLARKENVEFFENNGYFQEIELISSFAPFFPQRSIERMTNETYIEMGSSDKGFVRLALMNAVFRHDRDIARLTRLTPYGNITSNQRLSKNSIPVLVSLPREDNSTGTKVQRGKFENVLHMTRFEDNRIEIQSAISEYLFKCKYLNCKKLSTKDTEKIWARISMTEAESYILKALQIADGRIKRFNFVKVNNTTTIPMVLLDGNETKMPISEMGDGMTHILNIIISLLDCKNGVLLLDEAESGLHYSTQQELWRLIFELADKYNVQVFATTHSNDCVKSFAEISEQYNNDSLMFRLEKRDNNVVPVYYPDMQTILYSLRRGIEGR